MNLRDYYNTIRSIAASIETEFAVVVSVLTSDGGQPGVMTEVRRDQAARLVAENKAVLATPDQAQEYYATLRLRHAQQVEEEEKRRMALDVFSKGGLEALKKTLFIDE